jgi:hypothetical protein
MFDNDEDYDPEFEEISLDSFGGVDALDDDFGEDDEIEDETETQERPPSFRSIVSAMAHQESGLEGSGFDDE